MQSLNGKVALVTGASRGVGKGIALELIDAGAAVYITGRSVEDMHYISGRGIAIGCDHRDDEHVQSAFRRIADEPGRLDILVNNVWGGYENMKAATDKMTADMSEELREYNVAVVSLYPGLVKTEKVTQSAAWLDLSNAESPQFVGRAVVALATDTRIMERTGKVLVAASLAQEYDFTDIDGRKPRPLTLTDL